MPMDCMVYQKNQDKRLELWHQAGELGHSGAYYNIGNAYMIGKGVQRDMEQARQFWEKAAMLGHVGASVKRLAAGLSVMLRPAFPSLAIVHAHAVVIITVANIIVATAQLTRQCVPGTRPQLPVAHPRARHGRAQAWVRVI